mmetsp:Transcript_46896/g.111665  ORF Transcript_46896/g.111665 Transcript_46896/m.111665 type:complete len:101 (+) Transcript_46896:101-403(+)|eukprot:CAMPEP_0178402368 /NCGR_PEP_ID=MMETSP0689_2-20121128/16803_1 /TAXON_ID=160604 /ORGANISM="Amphidinium massartii, Strain CS-259" /LENGTH=100 /DNA_ID=CAMNT_0020023261 /DNA_START=60 /DNA_END=362 /DNA_ORIENTATION=+
MAHHRSMLLPVCVLVALAVAAFGGLEAFCGSASPSATTQSLRSTASRQALPVESFEVASSLSTALTVQTAGWWANIFFVVIPCGFLVTLYLQSERSKLEE